MPIVTFRQLSCHTPYFAPAVAKACDRHFRDLVPPREGKDTLYSHLFRAVYATIATFWFCPPEVSELEFRAAIQGHYKVLAEGQTELQRSMAAGRHYFDYEIANSVIAQHNGRRKGVRLDEPGVEVLRAFRRDGREPEEVVKMELKRVLISAHDKERVVAFQKQGDLATQDDALHQLLAMADQAHAIAQTLECGVEDLPGAVEQLQQQVEDERLAVKAAQAQVAEAERAISLVERGGSSSVLEQSLSMANEFNLYLKKENEQLKSERGQLLSEVDSLRSRLSQFEAMLQQFQQFQRFFNQDVCPVRFPSEWGGHEPLRANAIFRWCFHSISFPSEWGGSTLTAGASAQPSRFPFN